ncbi:MAG TPA: hypothetical protein PKC18_13590 [Lacipirellulaceae bacterium]|nr:hypothetical protein [Lacipirellulaceae bacterium]
MIKVVNGIGMMAPGIPRIGITGSMTIRQAERSESSSSDDAHERRNSIMFIRLGYFANFIESDAILLEGDAKGLKSLARLLESLEDKATTPIQIHELPFVQPYCGVKLTAYPVSRELGVQRAAEDELIFSWQHSQEGWLEVAEKIIAVASSGRGSNYLNAMAPEDAVVVVACEEYGPAWWARHSTAEQRASPD